jgi:nucleotide-binding universal stress UspA family protein
MMSKVKTILGATDLSPRSDKALARAARLAREHKARLAIVHVQEDRARVEAEPQQIAGRLEQDLREKVMGCSLDDAPEITVVTGRPSPEIIRCARDSDADLIVAGEHGANLFADLFGRATAESLVREGERPVLVVKRTARGPYRRVLAAVDFSEHSRGALEYALELAPGAEIHVVHAYEGVERQLWRADVRQSEIMRYRRQSAKQARQEIKAFLDGINPGNKRLRRGIWFGRAPHVITMVAKRLRADLVAVGTAGRTGLPHLLIGSVAQHVMREVPSDVLVVRSRPARMETGSSRPGTA